MYNINIIPLCALMLALFESVTTQKCNDCVTFDRCQPALDLALYKKNDETKQMFREASCGFENRGALPIAKVCCSAFSTLDERVGDLDTSEDTRVTNHRNLNLLPDDCGNIKGDRIVGGQIADLYEFPWMALISHETRQGVSFKCGGSIINKRYVLTAAHCVYNKIVAGIRVGEYDQNTVLDCQKDVCEKHIQDIPVERLVIHENYRNTPPVMNDIALIRLAKDVDFNHKNVHHICLPKTPELLHRSLDNVLATVTGWGITEENVGSSVLRKVTIPIHSAERCSNLYNRFLRPGDLDATAAKLCAGTTNKDSCNGDSGGPLMLEEKYNNVYRYVQYGIVSYGPQKCGSNYPGVYTDVTKFMGWILDNIY